MCPPTAWDSSRIRITDWSRRVGIILLIVFTCLPITRLLAQPELVMHLPLQDLDSSDRVRHGTVFRDVSGNGNHAEMISGQGAATNRAGLMPYTDRQVINLNDRLGWNGEYFDHIPGAVFDVENTFSVALWVNFFHTDDRQAIVGKHTDNGENQFIFGIYGDAYHVSIHGQTYEAGEPRPGWQHLAVVCEETSPNTTRVTVYRDAVPLWTHSIDAVIGDVGNGLGWVFGMEYDTDPLDPWSDFMFGQVTDIRIWNGAMTSEDLAPLLDNGTIDVTTTNAGSNANDGLTSLQEAFISANRQPGSHTISIPTGVYPISGSAGEDGGRDGDHDATNQVGTLVIKGAGPDQTIIDGSDLDRVLDLHPGTRTIIEDMTIHGGLLTYTSSNRGGGVRHTGDHLIVRNVVFTDNQAFSGGGLFNDGGDVEVVDVTFQENQGLLGAGMHQWTGSADLERVQFLGNLGGNAGGMYVTGEGGTAAASLFNVLFAGNHAVGLCGGLLSDNSAVVTIFNSSFVLNAGNDSGALYLFGTDLVTIHNSILWGTPLQQERRCRLLASRPPPVRSISSKANPALNRPSSSVTRTPAMAIGPHLKTMTTATFISWSDLHP